MSTHDRPRHPERYPATEAAPPLAVLLREGFRWFAERLNDTAAADGEARLSGSAAIVLSFLQPEGSRPAEIARAMGVSRQHVHTVVRELAAAGILTTAPDPTSGRDRLVVLTPDGEERRRRAITRLGDLEDELAERLGPGELDQTRRHLARLWGPSPNGRPDTRPDVGPGGT